MQSLLISAQACSYLPSGRAALTVGQYQTALSVTNLPKVTAQNSNSWKSKLQCIDGESNILTF